MKLILIFVFTFASLLLPNGSFDNTNNKPLQLSLENAEKLSSLPLKCIGQEYPNKLGQVITSDKDLKPPRELHPCFYGCYDWHSSVHGHWSLVKLLKEFSALPRMDSIEDILKNRITKEKVLQEVAYFEPRQSKTYERTYGWAWLLKLAQELHTWDTPLARELESNLQPLTSLIVDSYKTYLPKLRYPIRVGTHTNTAFGLSFAYDYVKAVNDTAFERIITSRVGDFYLKDKNYPLWWEPGGYDFLSPAFEEIDIMRKILTAKVYLS